MKQKILLLLVCTLVGSSLVSCKKQNQNKDKEGASTGDAPPSQTNPPPPALTLDQTLDKAQAFMMGARCQDAIDVLEAYGYQNYHADYLITLAAGYACLAGYKGNDFINGVNQEVLNSGDNIWGGFAEVARSTDLVALNDPRHSNMQWAIKILSYAGGIPTTENPSADERITRFLGNDNAADRINLELLKLLMANIGSYMQYYGGPTHHHGLKQGCLLSYDSAQQLALNNEPTTDIAHYIASTNGVSCSAPFHGHSELGTLGSFNRVQICEGITLINSYIDVFNHTDDVLGQIGLNPYAIAELTGLQGGFSYLQSYVAAPNNLDLTLTNRDLCVASSMTEAQLQIYFAAFIEGVFL